MGSLFTEFVTEVMAILSGTELLLSKNVTRRKRHGCCGSRAAVAAVPTMAKTSTISAVLWESMQGPEQLSGSKKKGNFIMYTRETCNTGK